MQELQTIEKTTDAASQLNAFLKGKENPFEVFVAARNPEANFHRHHAPTLYQDMQDKIYAVVNRYRVASLQRESDLPRSGAVVVRGNRGAGKTHMVHALRLLDHDRIPRVVVTPTIFEPHRSFIEYLLHQLLQHFKNETDGASAGTLDQLADAFTRLALAQALHGLNDVEWLARHADGKRAFLAYLWGWGTRHLIRSKRSLIDDLQQTDNLSIAEICGEHELSLETVREITRRNIEKQPHQSLSNRIRRALYLQLVERAFGAPADELYAFFEDGFTQVVGEVQPSRETLVDELLQALLELCLLAKMPVMYVFDALEPLLGDPPDPTKCHAFGRGIADVIDSHRGIPFLLFAEVGHWQAVYKNFTNYTRNRFEQGVPHIPQFGRINLISFPPITEDRLAEIVSRRMAPLLSEFHDGQESEVLPIFPFTPESLAAIAPGDDRSLRAILQALHDEYENWTNGTAAVQVPPVDLNREATIDSEGSTRQSSSIEQLESIWNREQRLAKRRLEQNTPASLADELYVGLTKWLEYLIAENVGLDQGKPISVENKILGRHPTYGQVVVYRWRENDAEYDVGVGLFVGTGRGMPSDLEAKLKMAAMADKPFSKLVILWPQGADLPPPYDQHLNGKTRKIWEQFERQGHTKNVTLRSVERDDWIIWLLLPRWLKAVQNELDDVTDDVTQHFVTEQTAMYLNRIAIEE